MDEMTPEESEPLPAFQTQLMDPDEEDQQEAVMKEEQVEEDQGEKEQEQVEEEEQGEEEDQVEEEKQEEEEDNTPKEQAVDQLTASEKVELKIRESVMDLLEYWSTALFDCEDEAVSDGFDALIKYIPIDTARWPSEGRFTCRMLCMALWQDFLLEANFDVNFWTTYLERLRETREFFIRHGHRWAVHPSEWQEEEDDDDRAAKFPPRAPKQQVDDLFDQLLQTCQRKLALAMYRQMAENPSVAGDLLESARTIGQDLWKDDDPKTRALWSCTVQDFEKAGRTAEVLDILNSMEEPVDQPLSMKSVRSQVRLALSAWSQSFKTPKLCKLGYEVAGENYVVPEGEEESDEEEEEPQKDKEEQAPEERVTRSRQKKKDKPEPKVIYKDDESDFDQASVNQPIKDDDSVKNGDAEYEEEEMVDLQSNASDDTQDVESEDALGSEKFLPVSQEERRTLIRDARRIQREGSPPSLKEEEEDKNESENEEDDEEVFLPALQELPSEEEEQPPTRVKSPPPSKEKAPPQKGAAKSPPRSSKKAKKKVVEWSSSSEDEESTTKRTGGKRTRKVAAKSVVRGADVVKVRRHPRPESSSEDDEDEDNVVLRKLATKPISHLEAFNMLSNDILEDSDFDDIIEDDDDDDEPAHKPQRVASPAKKKKPPPQSPSPRSASKKKPAQPRSPVVAKKKPLPARSPSPAKKKAPPARSTSPAKKKPAQPRSPVSAKKKPPPTRSPSPAKKKRRRSSSSARPKDLPTNSIGRPVPPPPQRDRNTPKVAFSAKETQDLIAGIRKFGHGNWSTIRAETPSLWGRSGPQLKDKARTLRKQGIEV